MFHNNSSMFSDEIFKIGYDYVFIKEMPGHLGERVNDEKYVPRACVHTILIRHPVKTLQSFINLYKASAQGTGVGKNAYTGFP